MGLTDPGTVSVTSPNALFGRVADILYLNKIFILRSHAWLDEPILFRRYLRPENEPVFSIWSLNIILLLSAFLGLFPLCVVAAGIHVDKLETLRQPANDMMYRPYFDGNALRWAGRQRKVGGICRTEPELSSIPCRTDWLLTKPNVLFCYCGKSADYRALVGLSDSGEVLWRRRTEPYYEKLIGVTPDALVLSNLEVIDPVSGATMRPPPMRKTNKGARPRFLLHNLAAYRSTHDDFVIFQAEVELLKASGGLFLFDPRTGQRSLIQPVRKRMLLWHLVPEAMAFIADGRYMLLALVLRTRGPHNLELGIFDMKVKRMVFQEEVESSCICDEIDIVIGPDGHVALFYRDPNEKAYVAVHFAVRF